MRDRPVRRRAARGAPDAALPLEDEGGGDGGRTAARRRRRLLLVRGLESTSGPRPIEHEHGALRERGSNARDRVAAPFGSVLFSCSCRWLHRFLIALARGSSKISVRRKWLACRVGTLIGTRGRLGRRVGTRTC